MTEYYREEHNKIQAGFALNAGKLLIQYHGLTANLPSNQKYDSTLTLCTLQALLTNCTELMDSMKRNQRQFWHDPIVDIPEYWGIKPSFIVKNTYPNEPTYGEFITHIRNAMSHPTSPDKPPYLPTTGYTTIPDESKVISKFRFTDSSWVSRGCVHSKASSSNEKTVSGTLKNFKDNNKNADVLEIRLKERHYQIFNGNEIYLPIFIAELPIEALTNLAIVLANHLAQPVDDKWDGETIQSLVA